MTKKHIYINGRFLTQTMTGVHRYAYEMCKALRLLGLEFTLISPDKSPLPSYDVRGWNIKTYGIGNSHFWEQLSLPTFFVGRKNYLLLNLTGLGSILVKNKITTIHDLAFLENPNWYSKSYYYYYRLLTPWVARSSQSIITVSDCSREEILRFYPFLRKKRIEVIYNACGIHKVEVKGTDTILKNNYCLAVQSIDPRKNLGVLLQAFKDRKDMKLYLVGGSNAVFSKVKDLAQIEHSDNIVYLGRVSDNRLVKLYTKAKAFISPSLFEGFGIPLIEAMSLRCPVICSDIPVYHEVCADAAIYFNPESADELSSCIDKVCTMDNKTLEETIERGTERAGKFSWQKSAQKLIELINDQITKEQ